MIKPVRLKMCQNQFRLKVHRRPSWLLLVVTAAVPSQKKKEKQAGNCGVNSPYSFLKKNHCFQKWPSTMSAIRPWGLTRRSHLPTALCQLGPCSWASKGNHLASQQSYFFHIRLSGFKKGPMIPAFKMKPQ